MNFWEHVHRDRLDGGWFGYPNGVPLPEHLSSSTLTNTWGQPINTEPVGGLREKKPGKMFSKPRQQQQQPTGQGPFGNNLQPHFAGGSLHNLKFFWTTSTSYWKQQFSDPFGERVFCCTTLIIFWTARRTIRRPRSLG